jgi:hypothetical protein
MLAAHEGANWPSKFGSLSVIAGLGQFLPNSTMQTLQPPHAMKEPRVSFRAMCVQWSPLPSLSKSRSRYFQLRHPAARQVWCQLTINDRVVPMQPVLDVRT